MRVCVNRTGGGYMLEGRSDKRAHDDIVIARILFLCNRVMINAERASHLPRQCDAQKQCCGSIDGAVRPNDAVRSLQSKETRMDDVSRIEREWRRPSRLGWISRKTLEHVCAQHAPLRAGRRLSEKYVQFMTRLRRRHQQGCAPRGRLARSRRAARRTTIADTGHPIEPTIHRPPILIARLHFLNLLDVVVPRFAVQNIRVSRGRQ